MQSFGQIDVDEQTLSDLNLLHVTAQPDAPDSEMTEFLSELNETADSVHPWTKLKIDKDTCIKDCLLESENKERPSTIFFYFGSRNGKQVFIGAAAIADKYSHEFPFMGRPVIGRSYILKEFRTHRMYYPILRHRILACVQRWGDDLIGVLMGSSNSRIFKSIRYNIFGIPFLYIGNVLMKDQQIIRNFIWLTDRYKTLIQNEIFERSENVPTEYENIYAQMVNNVFKLFVNQYDETSYSKLSSQIKSLPDDLLPQKLKPLVELFSSMSIIEASNKFYPIFGDPILKMRL